MSYVKDTVLLSSKTFPGADGTTWKEFVIAAENAAFAPGQFLMVAPVCGTGVKWPSALMIQDCSPKGYVVWVHPDCPLYTQREGDAVTIWGPNGTAAPVTGEFSVLCDAKGVILAAPLLRAWADRCRGLYLVGESHGAGLSELVGDTAIRAVKHLENAWDFGDTQSLVVALQLDKLACWKNAAPKAAEKSVVFVGAKVGCGMGACRGCYIHSGPVSTGIAVCQEGPFMPMTAVDYQKDQNFLGHYV